ncbi:MAG TPA: DUF6526 family protein [Acidobacteriaceae bacterium]|jgi:hypothetical protein|nr:DUF6526 family protein [Acidobacteriaceae bacterium]
MSNPKPQSFSSHASIDPMFHYVGLLAIVSNLGLGIVVLLLSLHSSHLLLAIWVLVLTLFLVLTFFKTRIYPLKLQDRIIRLEERLRMDALLPEPLRKRIPELTEDQLVGLRFASDEELASLVELTLDKQLNRKQIKERIQNWRADHFRI